MNTPETLKSISTGRCSIETWLELNYKEFKDYLSLTYPNIPIKEQLYLYYNHLPNVPTCVICGNPVKFHGNSYGYAKYCCPTCAQLDKETRDKIKQTCLERYGSDYEKHKFEKVKSTKLIKYGDVNYNNTEKSKQTCLERYGVDNVMKSTVFQEKSKQTCLERYGVEYNTQRPEFKESHKVKLLSKDSNIIDWDKESNTLTCKCPDLSCNLCSEKKYEVSYSTYYERINIYNICPCIKKIPLYTNTHYKDTTIEGFVTDILDYYNIKYIKHTKQIIHPFELDFYLPDYQIAIECNGIYWHSSKFKSPTYHLDKFKKCAAHNIQLITIWEDQINSKRDIVESIILSKLNIYNTKIYARNCVVRDLDSKTSADFLNQNHLQGSVNSSVRLGLYYGDKLISIMTFGKKRRVLGNKDTSGWELYRYCNLLNTQVIGGASKLFKHFIKTYNVQFIESYSSNDISNGNLYNVLGFKQKSESISYWYVKDKQRFHRYKLRKSELIKMGADKNKTEFQITDEMGYYRIYDTGQKKWIYNIYEQ